MSMLFRSEINQNFKNDELISIQVSSIAITYINKMSWCPWMILRAEGSPGDKKAWSHGSDPNSSSVDGEKRPCS